MDRPFDLQGGGGGMFFCFVQNFFSGQRKLEYCFFFVVKSTIFFSELNIKLYDKNFE